MGIVKRYPLTKMVVVVFNRTFLDGHHLQRGVKHCMGRQILGLKVW